MLSNNKRNYITEEIILNQFHNVNTFYITGEIIQNDEVMYCDNLAPHGKRLGVNFGSNSIGVGVSRVLNRWPCKGYRGLCNKNGPPFNCTKPFELHPFLLRF